MSDESDSDANVVTRGLGAIRDAFTGDSEDEQTQGDTARADDETRGRSRRAAEAYADTMQQCAAGDLTVRMAERGDDEAIDRIAAEFNEMVAELEQTTGHLKSYVGEVESAGVGVERSANTVKRASEDIFDSMQTISAEMGDQREQLEGTVAALDDITASLEQVAENHPDADIEPQINRLEQEVGDIQDAAETSKGVQSETNVVSAAVEELSAEVGEVSGRAGDLQRYANPLRAMLDRFETDSDSDSLMSDASATGDD